MATGRTCDLLIESGIPAKKIHKIYQGRPKVLDVITNRQVTMIINTPVGKKGAQDDSYIRKAAIRNRICYMTSMAAAMAAVEGIREHYINKGTGVRSLQDYHKEIQS